MDYLSGITPVRAPRPPATPAVSRLSLQVASSLQGAALTLTEAMTDVTSPAAAVAQLHAGFIDRNEDEMMAIGEEPETPRLVPDQPGKTVLSSPL